MKKIFSTKPLYGPARIMTGLAEGVNMPEGMEYVRQVHQMDDTFTPSFEDAIRYGFGMFSIQVINPRRIVRINTQPAPAGGYKHPFLNTDSLE